MDTQSRKEFFFKLVENELSKNGFKYLKAKNQFVKKEGDNVFIFAFDTWDWFYRVELNLKIIIGEIETIKKKAWGKQYDKFVTIGRTKSYLLPKPGDGSSLTDTEENVKNAAKTEIDFFYSFAKNYFVQHLDYKYLDSLLNTNPNEELLYIAYNPIHSSFLAIIVSALTKNPDLEKLCDFYRQIVQKHNDAYIEEYDLLVQYLKNNYLMQISQAQ